MFSGNNLKAQCHGVLASSDSDSENADSQTGLFLDTLLLAQVFISTVCLLIRYVMKHVLAISECIFLTGI